MYTVTILCDEEQCKSKVQVPQVGAFPTGWLSIQFAQPTLNKDLSHGTNQNQVKIFCGWRCCYKFIKYRLGNKELEDG